MWQAGTPRPGKRIVALYNDGSGATLFAVVDDGEGGALLFDSDGEQYSIEYLTEGESYGGWAYLTDDTKLWCELRADEPMNFGN